MNTETESPQLDRERILMRRIFTLEKALSKYNPPEWEQWGIGDKLTITQPDSIYKGGIGELINWRYYPDGLLMAVVKLAAGEFLYPPMFLSLAEKRSHLYDDLDPIPFAIKPDPTPAPIPEPPKEVSIEVIAKALTPIASMAGGSSKAAGLTLKGLFTKHTEARVRQAISTLSADAQQKILSLNP